MRHTSRKTNVNAKQCKLYPQQQTKPRHRRWFRGVSSARTRALKQHALAVALPIVFALFSSLSAAANTALDQARMYQLNLPEQTVAAALTSLSEQTDIQVLFPYDIATQHRIVPLVGSYQLQHALERLLHNTGLHGGLTDSGVITISRIGSNVEINQNGKGKRMNTNKRKTLLATFVALFASGATVQANAQNEFGESARAQNVLDEIIVTATKREESVQDAALSITAISSDVIDKKGFVGMMDYLRITPGVSMINLGAGRKNAVTIRGITASPEAEDGSVGVYFGEVPLTASNIGSNFDFGSPDLKLVDVERVEVLRGPQGTLYGSGSMAGTVRIVPIQPNMFENEAKFSTGYSNTGEGGSDNYHLNGMVNVPLIEDKLSIRMIGYKFENSGYIQNIAASSDGFFPELVRSYGGITINEDGLAGDETTGGRVSVKWQPVDNLRATLSHIRQESQQLGQPDVELSLGAYQQARGQTTQFVKNGNESEVEITNLEAAYTFNGFEVLSSTSWMDSRALYGRDITNIGFPSDQQTQSDVDVFVEELRLTSSLEGPTQFLIGMYYEDITWNNHSLFNWSGAPDQNFLMSSAVLLGAFEQRYAVEQKAVFGEISYDIGEALKFTLGGRWFEYDKTEMQLDDNSPVFFIPEFDLDSSENGSSYKANLTYTPTDDALMYAQWSEGFRLGKPISPLGSRCDPDGNNDLIAADGRLVKNAEKIESDTIDSYEIGGKFSLLENRMTINASIFHIDWNGIPISITDASASCTAVQNAGEAQSQGVEVESSFLVTDLIKMDLSLSYLNAELTEDAGILGSEGDRLPSTPNFSANLSIQKDFELQGYPAFLRGDYSYVGGFYNNLQQSGTEAGNYNQVNVKAGMSINQVDIDVFVNNLTNSDDLTWVQFAVSSDGRAHRLRPRTIGINFTHTF